MLGCAQLWFVVTGFFLVATLSPGALFAAPPPWIPWVALALVLAGPLALALFGGATGRRRALSAVLALLATASALIAAVMFAMADTSLAVLSSLACLLLGFGACWIGRWARPVGTAATDRS